MWAGAASRWVRTAWASSASCPMEYGPAGLPDRPAPRLSMVMTLATDDRRLHLPGEAPGGEPQTRDQQQRSPDPVSSTKIRVPSEAVAVCRSRVIATPGMQSEANPVVAHAVMTTFGAGWMCCLAEHGQTSAISLAATVSSSRKRGSAMSISARARC